MEELKIDKARVLEAAAKCSTANAMLRTLFPEAFEPEKPEPFCFGDEYELDWDWRNGPIAIGLGCAPLDLRYKSLVVNRDFRMETTEHNGRTILTFYPEPK